MNHDSLIHVIETNDEGLTVHIPISHDMNVAAILDSLASIINETMERLDIQPIQQARYVGPRAITDDIGTHPPARRSLCWEDNGDEG